MWQYFCVTGTMPKKRYSEKKVEEVETKENICALHFCEKKSFHMFRQAQW